MKINKRGILGFCLFTIARVYGQDIHWSQPTSILIYQNPAFTGIMGKYSLGINYRDQWRPMNRSFSTYALSGDYRFDTGSEKTIVSAGGVLYRDVSADGSYIINAGGGTMSCLLTIDRDSRLGLGIGYTMSQSNLKRNQYSWGNQFDGYAYNPALNTGEDVTGLSKTFSDLSLGVSYLKHKKSATLDDNNPDMMIVGYSANHVNQPQVSLTGGNEKLLIRHTFMFTSINTLRDNLAIKPIFVFYAQGKMIELTGGTLMRWGIGQVSKYTGIRKGASFSAGLLYRFKDALIPIIEFEKAQWALGLSYDLNPFNLANSGKYRRGLEISMRLKAAGKKIDPEKKVKTADQVPMY